MTAVREYCPVGELSGERHTYVAGRGIVVPWDVAGDPRPNVEICHACNDDDGWRWRADRGGWTHCDDRAEYDDDGATCRKCYRFMSHDDAAARMIE